MSIVICENPRYVYINIPESGGSAVIEELKKKVPDRKYVQHDIPNHGDINNVVSLMGSDWVENSYSFCFIRNPWARLWAIYNFRLYKIRNRINLHKSGRGSNDLPLQENLNFVREMVEMGFSNWIINTELDKQFYGVPITRKSQLSWGEYNGNQLIKNIFRIEDTGYIPLNQLGLDSVEWYNKLEYSKDCRSQYTSEARDFVAHYFAKDIRFGNYTF